MILRKLIANQAVFVAADTLDTDSIVSILIHHFVLDKIYISRHELRRSYHFRETVQDVSYSSIYNLFSLVPDKR